MREAHDELARLKDQLEREQRYLREEIKHHHNFDDIVGKSDAIQSVFQSIEQVSGTDATVLLLGETGTGKELIARAIHANSKRHGRALIKVDCTTLPAGLVESELFGHVKGAFTGAAESRAGRFELADGGTIFLDEIGELSGDLQAKLLRVLQEGEVQRLGSQEVQNVDVRVIAATNRDMKRELEEGRFRADLFYRLNVFPLEIPALRYRHGDIPLLAASFISNCASRFGKRIERVTMDSQEMLAAYDWPGNVRELQNVIERSVILSSGGELKVIGIPDLRSESLHAGTRSLKENLNGVERRNILRTLEGCDWKIKGEGNAASQLGLNPSTLRSRMNRLGISRP
jgi:transcriptional regulator with GAF, ATPase, and Fis domain